MRHVVLGLAFALAACGQSEPLAPAPQAPQTVATAPAPWFICDAINAPVVAVFIREGETAHVAEYDKPNGALVQRSEYNAGASEGAAGSVYTTLLQNGAEAGSIRQINPGMLETPASAYTAPFTSVRLGEVELSCRWMPRTRLMGITGRRTIVVSEDQDGDLLYHSYDFANAARAQPIDIAENGRTTTFSLEARDGGETVNESGARYTFQADVETEIIVTASSNGAGAIEVRRHGADPLQSEDLIAYIEGDGNQP